MCAPARGRALVLSRPESTTNHTSQPAMPTCLPVNAERSSSLRRPRAGSKTCTVPAVVRSTTSTTWRGTQVLPMKIADTRPARRRQQPVEGAGEAEARHVRGVRRERAVAAGVAESCRATAHGGVPNARGHGICARPVTSEVPVIRWCMVSASARNRSLEPLVAGHVAGGEVAGAVDVGWRTPGRSGSGRRRGPLPRRSAGPAGRRAPGLSGIGRAPAHEGHTAAYASSGDTGSHPR